MATGGDMFVSSKEKGMKEGQEMKERILYVADSTVNCEPTASG
jgi:hypothetical protein